MSPLKKQLRLLLPKLAKDANQLRDVEARSRWMRIKLITDSPKSIRKACGFYGMSEDSFNKWAKRLWKFKSIQGLFSKSRKPWRSPNQTKKRIERKILSIRRVDPSLGPERIANDLKRLFGLLISPSAVYAVLKRAGVVGMKLMKKLTKKHLKRYRRPLPGYLQMDFKYVPYKIESKQYYQLSCVDHHSSWRLIRIYPEKSTDYVIKFLNELEGICPFPIMEIQTDNDAAFTDKFSSRVGVTGFHPFDRWCLRREIVHRLIPVGQKELNGKVENTHKQDDREFYAKGPYKSLENIQLNILGYNDRWNSHRRTKALGFKMPDEVIADAYVRAAGILLFITRGRNQGLHNLNQQGDAYMQINETKSEAKIQTRKPSYVERYMQYMHWENTKKKLPAIFLDPMMSQNFSLYKCYLMASTNFVLVTKPKDFLELTVFVDDDNMAVSR